DCQGIGREHMGGVAKGGSRQLVQQDDEGQGAVRRIEPMVQSARGGGEVAVAAPLGEGAVEGRVLGEPLVGAGIGPEGDDFGGGQKLGHAASLAAAREKARPREGLVFSNVMKKWSEWQDSNLRPPRPEQRSPRVKASKINLRSTAATPFVPLRFRGFLGVTWARPENGLTINWTCWRRSDLPKRKSPARRQPGRGFKALTSGGTS